MPEEIEGGEGKAEPEEMMSDEARANPLDRLDQLEDQITPEMLTVLGTKREALLSDGQFAFRFVNIKEHLDTVRNGVLSQNSSVNVDTIRGFLTRYLSWHVPAARHTHKDRGGAWYMTANERTNWTAPSAAMFMNAELGREYMKALRQVQEEGGTTQDARILLFNKLKSMTAHYLKELYGDLGELPEGTSVEERAMQLVKNPNPAIDEKHRLRLIEILEKDPEQLDNSDLRFVGRFAYYDRDFARGQFKLEGSSEGWESSTLPYQLLQIWNADSPQQGLNPWENSRGYQSIPNGTSTEKILGVVAAVPSDIETIEELTKEMIKASKSNPEQSHIIIDTVMFERFPQRGTDFLKLEEK